MKRPKPLNLHPKKSRHVPRPSAVERGYDWRWHKARSHYLADNPLCVCCFANGYVCAASVVDHIVRHRGNWALMWERGNWQSLCAWCHDHVKQVLEDRNAPMNQLKLDRIDPLWRHPVDR